MISGHFIVLDAARMYHSMEAVCSLNPTAQSLYLLEKDDPVQQVAPYLFQLADKEAFCNYFMDKGWGDSWGIIIFSNAGFEEVKRHLRRFLMVKTEDGVELYFRFYDPRVLRIFLPSCDPKQVMEFFGPVNSFLLEDEDPRFGIQYWHENGHLQFRQIPLRELSAVKPVYAGNRPLPPTSLNTLDDLKKKDDTVIKDRNTELNKGFVKPSKPRWNMLD